MSDFTAISAQLSDRAAPLVPTQIHDLALSKAILDTDLFPGKGGAMAQACRAGLLLLNDDLDAAHPFVQAPETEINNFWHAILHRREGDFGNARYWWHRVGTHSAMAEIYDVVMHRIPDFPFLDELRQQQQWEPQIFNEFCERSAKTGDWDVELRAVQRLEMKILLEWCASRVK